MTDIAIDGAESALQIDGYEMEAVVGSGGMGTVYRARQISLGRPVAIKVLAEAFRRQPTFVARFRQEARLQATLQHPNVVPVFSNGESQGAPYIVMRFVAGPSLRQLLRVGDLEVEHVVELLEGIAAALDFAHGSGVLHLDVKPHNILIEGTDHAWLADFGLTRMLEERSGVTLSSGLVGSFDYLAPEIAFGQEASPASDLYSFGVTSFQTLTGSLPFPAAHQAAALFAHASSPRPRASDVRAELPRQVDRVLQRCMSIDPSERYPSAGEFVDDLRGAAGMATRPRRSLERTAGVTPGVATAASPEAPSWARTVAPRRKSAGRRRVAVLAGVVACLVAGVTALMLSLGGSAYSLPAKTFPETVGGVSHTFSNYEQAEGYGPLISAHATVRIACRLKGYTVQDGNRWWYRIASKPWDGRFYVSADAFYNNGHKTGTLRGTPFVDRKVSTC